MNLADFHAQLRVLASLDMHDLVDVGVLEAHDIRTWHTFRLDPLRWMLKADLAAVQAVWLAMQRRVERKAEVDRASDCNVVHFLPRKRATRQRPL
jgi:hypothetical protein